MSDFIQQLIGFFVLIFLARKLNPDGYGLFNVIISIATIFGVLSQFGTSNVITRELSLNPETTDSFIKKIILPFRIVSFVFAVICFLIYNYIDFSVDHSLSLYVILIILNLSLWNSSESIAFGHEVTKYSSILNIFFSITWFISIIIIPEKLLDISLVLIVFCLLHFIRAATYIIIVYQKFYLSSISNLKKLEINFLSFFKMSIPYVWLLLIFTLSNQLPVLLLNNHSSLEEVAFYAIGFKLMIPISIAVGTLFKAVFPSLTRLFSENKSDFEAKILMGFNIIFVFGTMAAIITSITSEYWLPFLFGSEYYNAILVFDLLIWFSVITIVDTLLSNALSSAYKERVLAILSTIDFLIILPIFYIVSKYGAWGIAISKLLTGFIFLIFHLFVFAWVLNLKLFNKNLFVILSFYFLSMGICLLIDNIIFQLSSVCVLILFFLLIKNSPFKVTFDLSKKIIKNLQ